MPLVTGCPRCSTPLIDGACPDHHDAGVLWRASTPDYETFAEALTRAGESATYLPWPMSPGWSVSGFGCVLAGDCPVATVTSTTGASDLDGEVEVTIVSEEPGVGLGARCAGLISLDPGRAVGQGPAAVRVRLAQRGSAHGVSLWAVPADEDAEVLATSVFVGEAHGRWLWLILHPASAALLLRDDWLLLDAGGFGPEAIEMPFGGTPPTW